MAERVDDSLLDDGRRGKYRWDEWLDGSTWLLKEGEDFKNFLSFRSAAYATGTKRGGKTLIRTVADGVFIRFQKNGDAA